MIPKARKSRSEILEIERQKREFISPLTRIYIKRRNLKHKRRLLELHLASWIMPIPFIFGGLLVIFIELRGLNLCKQAESWVEAEAVFSNTYKKGDTKRRLSYLYEVNGVEISGVRTNFSPYTRGNELYFKVRGIKDHSTLTVYYNPEDPTQSTLFRAPVQIMSLL